MGPGCTGLQPETAASPALAAPSTSRPERPVPRVRIGPALPDRKSLDAEIARLRDLGVSELRSRWHTVFGRQPPPHLPRHLLFRVLVWLPRTQIRAYRWCSPPRIGCAIMSPNRSIGRVQGASLPSERCVRTSYSSGRNSKECAEDDLR